MKVGDQVYIVLNNSKVVPVIIVSVSDNIYTIKFLDNDGAIRLPKHRLFASEDEAWSSVPDYKKKVIEKRGYRPPDFH
jgi:predicted transcriptional regulator